MQIVLLDAVFSLDSVITAVGMVDELPIMVAAVCIAMAVMLVASKPLMAFISRHPTVIILGLGFLLMIGFSLVAEGLGLHIPKGYLYAAIGFSILIEAANQLGRRKRAPPKAAGREALLRGLRDTPDGRVTITDAQGQVRATVSTADALALLDQH
ncbi:TerC family protein [Nitrospirillum sp. BR 11163]|uniref:TerC family protein n=1 Tax=Nitrospirillum sp. BR 11163 TaxID=3104323 RepID=UPI002AFEAEF9|nr:TerC family protein [Nitrospirillum sp. BR 11163]MEA1675701.1 TerC family protein [Nitrospirillum sp. BR 11163]